MNQALPSRRTTEAFRWGAIAASCLAAGSIAGATEKTQPGRASTDPVALYTETIKPVLQERCYACHGALKQQSGLRLDTGNRLRAGADDGTRSVLVIGSPEESELIQRLSSEDPDHRMPPEGEPVADSTIEAIRHWIAAGAPSPPDEREEEDPRDHWSFQPIEKPDLPVAGNPVDFFLDRQRMATGVIRQPIESESSLLIRRLYLDLIGLPPTGPQLKDTRPWSEIVDELLASPHHGERWGRHWMDVWRYSDWYGLGAQLRNSQKHLWHWRDWIVDSLNEDKGYDRMIQEMLAGDELAPGDPEVVRATGFLARNYFLFNRTTWLDNTIEHTGKAFLGLTLNCAKCHDHKYDPVEMADYYRFRALFEPHQVRLDPVPGVTDFEKDGIPRVFDDQLDAETFLHLRGDPKQPDRETHITPGVPAFLSAFAPEIEPVSLPREAYAPGSRDYVRRDRLATAEAAVIEARQKLSSARERLAAQSVASETSAKGQGKEDRKRPAGEPWLSDDFSQADEERWELIGEGWEYRDGQLWQTRASRDRALLRSRAPHPRDFDLSCRYTTTGGDTYRSVSFRFDLSDDGEEASFVYTSAHAPGPKLQVAHTTGGKTAYPAGGRVARPIEIGKTYTLRFAVRDRLINVWLDDEFQLAYELPRRRESGKLSLSGFDATVSFDEIIVRPLPEGMEMTAADTPKGEKASPEALAESVKLEEARLAHAEAEQESLRATIAADEASEGSADSSDHRAVREKEAARLQAEAERARTRLEVLKQEAAGDAKKLAAARKALAAAEKTLKESSYAFSPLRASRKALETPAHQEGDYPAVYPDRSSGRRLMLARWIASPENPLTARVAVNHVWMRHFGEPLVDTVFDFGRQAERPVQAELLDYLAAEFMASGWSFKHLHRLMVNSEAYRLTTSLAGADAATLAADPGNRYYWRMNSRRMEAQVVRDSLLHLAGELDAALGGPPVAPGGKSRRRSLYFNHSPNKRDLFLMTFDDADLLQCYRRSESVVPQQALALSNSDLSEAMAEALAERLTGDGQGEDRAEFVVLAFEAILGRAPVLSETTECLSFCEVLAESLARSNDANGAAGELRVRRGLVHALLNHNDFVTIR